MSDELWSTCQACGGRGVVPRQRAYMTADGTVTTIMADGRCEHCREHPGHQRGNGQAPPA